MYLIPLLLANMLFAMTGEELSILMDNRKSPDDISSDMNMEITNKKGKKRSLKVKSISKDNSKKLILWFLSPADDKGIAWIFFIIWNVHYFNRSIIFPLRQKQTAKCPIAIVLSAVFFNIINGFTNGYFLGYLAQYDFNYIYSVEFIIGFMVLILGIIINIKSDNILIQIKKKNNGYQVTNGFLYNYVSCPNYLGEFIDWREDFPSSPSGSSVEKRCYRNFRRSNNVSNNNLIKCFKKIFS